MKRIFVDFNTMNQDFPGQDESHRHVIIGSPAELKEPLNPNEEVMLTDDTLEVMAVVVFTEAIHCWLARPDWSTRHFLAA